MDRSLPAISILGMHVNSSTYALAGDSVMEWAHAAESRYVCVATVNNVMESYDSPEFRRVMNGADLVLSDGMPLVWGLRLLGENKATRVYGPDLTPVILARAEREGVPVGFYGGSPEVLQRLVVEVEKRFPRLVVVFRHSPPFRPLTLEEDEQVSSEINASGSRILFVGLSTPKQDRWMAKQRGRTQAVMLGVGAAFDFLAGAKPQAPRWVMAVGLEWLFRLATEPGRLWRRYLKQNPRFVVLFGLQLLGLRHYPSR